MKKSSRIRLLLLCLIVSIVSFAFACSGGDNGGDNGGSNPPVDVTLDEYIYDERDIEYNTYGEVTVDGKLDEAVWENQIKLNRELVVGGANYAVEMSAYFADDGVIMYIDVVTDGGVYINKLRSDHYNSGMEVYITSGDKTTPLMNTWEIPLMANGRYNSRLYTWEGFLRDARCYVDVKTQIDGLGHAPLSHEDINLTPEQTNGYTMEFYVPYANLNEMSKPSSITMTAAVVHLAGFTSDVRNWVDIHQACDGAGAQYALDIQYAFNEQGYLDRSIDTVRTYKVNGVENSDGIVENGYLELDIPTLVGETGSITAIPNPGYMFDYFIVNGVKQDLPFYEIKKNMGNLDIQVGFKSLDGADVVDRAEVTIVGPEQGILGYDIEGKEIRLFSEKGIFFAEVVDGAVVFENIPVGEYTFSIPALTGIDTEIVFETGISEYTVVLEYKLFNDETTDATLNYTYNEADQSYTLVSTNNTAGNERAIAFSTDAGKIVWAEMTVGFDLVKSGVTDDKEFILNSIKGTINSSMNIGIWWVGKDSTGNEPAEGNELRLRTSGTDKWSYLILSNVYTASNPDKDLHARLLDGEKITVAINLLNTTASIFYKMEADTEWYLWQTLYNYKKIVGISSRGAEETITGIKVANESSMYDAGIVATNLTVNDDAMGTVLATGSIYGGQVRVIPKANEGYMLYELKVNGVSYPLEVAKFNTNGGAIYVPGKSAFTNNVEVTFGPALETKEYTITIFDANNNPINGQITLVSASHTTVAKTINGVATVALIANADYVLSVDGYEEVTISIDADGNIAETSFVLDKSILYTESKVFDYGVNDTDGNWFTSTTNAGDEVLFIEGSDWSNGKAVSFHLNAELANAKQYIGFRVYDGANYVAFQLSCSNGVFEIKRTRPNYTVLQVVDTNGAEVMDNDFIIYIEGNTVVFTMDGEYVTSVVVKETYNSAELISEIDRVGFFFQVDANPDFKVTHVEVSNDKYDFVDYKVKESADAEFTTVAGLTTNLEMFNLTVNSLQLVPGKKATFTITPNATTNNEPYFVTGIAIDGVAQAFEASATGEIVIEYVIPADATAVEIVVNAAVQKITTGTMKIYLASFAGNEVITDLANVLFNGNVLSNATIDADGTISFSMNTGIYEIKYVEAGYEAVVITLSENDTDLVIYLNKIAFTSSSNFNVSYDYNGVDGVTISKTAVAREDIVLNETVEGLVGFSFKFEIEGNTTTKTFPHIYVTDSTGLSVGYQISVWNGNITLKPAFVQDGVAARQNVEFCQVGKCNTGLFSADVNFFAVGTDLVIVFTNVISNGQPANDVVFVQDFSINNTAIKDATYDTVTITDRFNGTVEGLRIGHKNDGASVEAKRWAIKNFALMTAIPTAQVNVTSLDNAVVETSEANVVLGYSTTITVTPDSNNVIVTDILLNGEAVEFVFDNGIYTAVWTNTDANLTEANVTVVAEEKNPQIYTINVDYKTAQENVAYRIDGRKVIFTGEGITREAVIADGQVTIELLPGDYTAKLENGATLAFVATEDPANVGALSFVGAQVSVIGTASSMTTNEDGTYNFTSRTMDNDILVAKGTNLGGLVVSFNYSINSTSYDGQGIKIFTANKPADKQRFNLLNAFNSSLCIKNQNAGVDGDYITISGPAVDAEVLVVISEDGKTITITMSYNGQTITRVWTDGSEIIRFELGCVCGVNASLISWSMDNIRISDTKSVASVGYQANDELYTYSQIQSGLAFGETTTFTIIPANRVIVTGVTANGVALPVVKGEDGNYTVTLKNNGAFGQEIAVEVSTMMEEKVEVVLDVKLASFAGNQNVGDISKLTFNGETLEAESVTAEGKFVLKIDTGIYTIAYVDGGYETVDLTIDGSVTEFVIYLNKIAFTGSSNFVVSYDYNGEDGVTVTDSSSSRQFIKLAQDGLVGFSFKFVANQGVNGTYPIVYLTNTDGISASYQLCLSSNTLTIKPGIHDGTTNGLQNKELAVVGYNSTGLLSADVNFFAVGSTLVIAFTNVISNGVASADVIYAQDFSSANAEFKDLSWGVTAKFDNSNIAGIMIAHDGAAGWMFKNIGLMTEIPSAEVIVSSTDKAEITTTATELPVGFATTITVTPNANVTVTSILVNGSAIEFAYADGIYTAVYTNNDLALETATISIEYIEVVQQEYTINIDYKTVQETMPYRIDGRKVTFVGEGITREAIIADGKVTVELLPGNYTVSLENGATLAFVATEDVGAAEGSLLFVYDSVEILDGITKTDNEDRTFNITSTVDTNDTIIVAQGSNLGGVLVRYDFTVIPGAGKGDQGEGVRITTANGTKMRFNCMTNGSSFIRIKAQEANDNGPEFPISGPVVDAPTSVSISEDGKTITIVVQVGDTLAKRVYTADSVITKLEIGGIMMLNGQTWSMNNVLVSDINAANELYYNEGEEFNFTSYDVTIAQFGQEVTFTAEPMGDVIEDGKVYSYEITGATINDTAISGVKNEDGTTTFSFTNYGQFGELVEIFVTTIKTEKNLQYTIDVEYRTAQETVSYPINGRTLTFVGLVTREVVVTDGKVVVELAPGDYTVSLGNGTTATFVAGEETTGSLSLVAPAVTILGYTAKVDNADGSYNFAPVYMEDLIEVAKGTNIGGTVATFDYNLTLKGTYNWDEGQGIKIFTANSPATKIRFKFTVHSNSKLYIQQQSASLKSEEIAISGAVTNAKVIVSVSEDGKTLNLSLTYNGKTVTLSWTDGSNITSLQIGAAMGMTNVQSVSFNNFRVTDTKSVSNIVYSEGAEYSYVANPSTVAYGETVAFTVKPAADVVEEGKTYSFVVNGATVNGSAVAGVENEDGSVTYSITNNGQFGSTISVAIDASKVEKIVEYTFEVEYKTAQDAEFYSIDGRKVTITGAMTKEAIITDGKIVVELAPGEYVATLENGAALTFVANETSKLSFVKSISTIGAASNLTTNEDGTYNFTTRTFDEVILVGEGTNLAGTIVKFNYSVNSTNYEGQGIKLFTANKPYTATGSNKQRFNLLNGLNQNLYIKDQNANQNGEAIAITGEVVGAEVMIIISEDGKTVNITMTYNGKTIGREYSDGSAITRLEIGCVCGVNANLVSWSMNNIKVTDMLASKSTEYTFNVEYRTAQETDSYAINGRTVTFVSADVIKEAVVADGKVVVELAPGEYVAKLGNGAELNINTDEIDTLSFVGKEITFSGDIEVSENEDGTFNIGNNKTQYSVATIASGSNLAGLLVTYEYSITPLENQTQGEGVRIFTKSNTAGRRFNCFNENNTAFAIKDQEGNNDGEKITITGPVQDAHTVVYISEDGKTLNIAITVEGTTVTRVYTDGSVITKLEIGGIMYPWGQTWSMNNIMVSDIAAIA